jgi:hypothetical protein
MTTAADRYVEAINVQDFTLLEALMHPDVVMHHPIGTFEGRGAVFDFYRDVVFPVGTKIELRGEVLHSPGLEIFRAVGIPNAESGGDEVEPQYVVDVFELDADGRVTTIEVYLRSF